MVRRVFRKPLLIALIASLSFSSLFAQNCEVLKPELKGTYTGDCRRGKAHGQGKAVGIDTYVGNFKAGLPDGEGTYTWKNGNVYTGHFSKGFRDGQGSMKYEINGKDSTVTGFWKKDVYLGKYAHPYSVLDKSSMVQQVDIQYTRDDNHTITFEVSNTRGGDPMISNGGVGVKMKITNIIFDMGVYGRMTNTDSHAKSTETILYQVVFPARMKVFIGDEYFYAEFRQPGSYIVTVNINL